VLVGGEARDHGTYDIEGVEVPVYRASDQMRTDADESDGAASAGPIAESVGAITEGVKAIARERLVPDFYIAYAPGIYRDARRIVRAEQIDVVYTMCYPFSFHLVGLALKRTESPAWLAEFRDPWVTNPNHFDGEAGWLNKTLERRVVAGADQVVYNYGIQVPENYFTHTYPEYARKVRRMECPGSTGFDFEQAVAEPDGHGDTFRMIYGGSFYGDGHSPVSFLRGLGQFLREEGADESRIRADFFGDWSPEYQTVLEEESLEGVVESHGWISPVEFEQELFAADAALFIVRPFPGDELNVPQKIVDYIATRSPMLVLADHDWEVSSFTRRHDLGVVADPSSPDEVATGFAELYDAFRTDTLDRFTYDEQLRELIDAETQARKFSEALDAAIDHADR
jgi:hypothetical protein